MAIERIDLELCNGCVICVNSCSRDVIRMDKESKKAIIKYPEDCNCCLYCVSGCPKDAIFVSPGMAAPLPISW